MSNQTPKSRPIQDDRQISSLFPTRFLKPAQLIAWKVTELIVTIARIVEEEVQPKPGQTEWKAVIYFMAKDGTEHPQGYLLSAKIDAESLTNSTGCQSIGEIPGKQIKIKLDVYRGKGVLRIDPKPITTPIEPADEPQREEPKSDPNTNRNGEVIDF